MSDQYVTTVTPNDVLFGRGSGPNDHEGNIKFRDTVSQHKAEYMATNHRQTKAKIAKAVVDTVFANNGRFLKKLEPAEVEKMGLNSGMDIYVVVDDDTIMEKAKQALRQNRDKNTPGATSPKRNTQSPVPPGVMSSNPIVANQLPPTFVPGNNGQFPVAPNMMAPTAAYPMDQPSNYQEDAEGYATYTATLDDPEDAGLFGPRRMSATGPRRGSLLGGRKDGGPRRDSIQMMDVWRSKDSMMGKVGESMQMSELMESFKGMSTTGMNSSSDTIGTIEGDLYGKSQMSMSAMSVNSTTSLFKSSSSDKLSANDSADAFSGLNSAVWNQQTSQQQPTMPPRNDTGLRPAAGGTRNSLIPKEAWNSSTLQNLMQSPLEGSSAVMNMESSAGGALHHPPDSMGFLGVSSMSVLRAVDEANHGQEHGDDQYQGIRPTGQK